MWHNYSVRTRGVAAGAIPSRIITVTPRRLTDGRSVTLSCRSASTHDGCNGRRPNTVGMARGDSVEVIHFWWCGNPVPDTDSGSLFHFSHHCGIWDFRRFISISHTVSNLGRHWCNCR